MSDEVSFPPPSLPTVLIASNDQDAMEFYTRLLGDFYTLTYVTTSFEAAEEVSVGCYDALVIHHSAFEDMAVEVEAIHKSTLTPLLVVGKNNTEEQKVIECLDAGADDHFFESVHPQEFLARVRKTLRRKVLSETKKIPNIIEHKGVIINLSERRVKTKETAFRLSPIETKILEALIRKPKKLYFKEHLIEHIWGADGGTPKQKNQHLRTYIMRIRKKLGDNPATPEFIATEGALGYRWMVPAHAETDLTY